MTELLLGCGSKREKRLAWRGGSGWSSLVTLDINPDHKPDLVYDLNRVPLPIASDTFDEIHAYDVMEHVGQQGDWRFFFNQWADLWRILKPDGLFLGVSPHWSSPWAWGDPGHTRVVAPENMVYLDQNEYKKQVGVTPMTDYRFVYKADFETLQSFVDDSKQFYYILRAIKPSRCPT